MPEPITSLLVNGQPREAYELALVTKRTYRIRPDGRCELDDEQLGIALEPEHYPGLEGEDQPGTEVPCWDPDTLAFKEATDLVVQGHAYAYGKATTTEASVQVGERTRTIRVHGDRTCVQQGGSLTFTAPEPFERMPLRHDRAYGGYDEEGQRVHGDRTAEIMAEVAPEFGIDRATRFHYPRNPGGRGFHIATDPARLDGSAVPNLEFPFDPITPQRMHVPDGLAWVGAPLPATFDWIDPAWFPRISYLGYHPETAAGSPAPREVELGWSPENLLSLPPLHKLGFQPAFLQAASPGMVFDSLEPGTQVRLTHLFQDAEVRDVELPREVPAVRIRISASDVREARPQLCAVVIRPDEERLIQVWGARCDAGRPYTEPQLAEMSWDLAWS